MTEYTPLASVENEGFHFEITSPAIARTFNEVAGQSHANHFDTAMERWARTADWDRGILYVSGFVYDDDDFDLAKRTFGLWVIDIVAGSYSWLPFDTSEHNTFSATTVSISSLVLVGNDYIAGIDVKSSGGVTTLDHILVQKSTGKIVATVSVPIVGFAGSDFEHIPYVLPAGDLTKFHHFNQTRNTGAGSTRCYLVEYDTFAESATLLVAPAISPAQVSNGSMSNNGMARGRILAGANTVFCNAKSGISEVGEVFEITIPHGAAQIADLTAQTFNFVKEGYALQSAYFDPSEDQLVLGYRTLGDLPHLLSVIDRSTETVVFDHGINDAKTGVDWDGFGPYVARSSYPMYRVEDCTIVDPKGHYVFHYGARRTDDYFVTVHEHRFMDVLTNRAYNLQKLTRFTVQGNPVYQPNDFEDFPSVSQTIGFLVAFETPTNFFWTGQGCPVENGGGNGGGEPEPEPPPTPDRIQDSLAITLRFSDTRGASWEDGMLQSLGEGGEYETSVIWRGLGMGRGRTFELSWSATVQTALSGAYIEVEPGET